MSGKKKKWFIIFIKILFTSNVFVEAYSEPCQISKVGTFTKIVNRLKPLVVFTKNYILDVCLTGLGTCLCIGSTDFTFL